MQQQSFSGHMYILHYTSPIARTNHLSLVIEFKYYDRIIGMFILKTGQGLVHIKSVCY